MGSVGPIVDTPGLNEKYAFSSIAAEPENLRIKPLWDPYGTPMGPLWDPSHSGGVYVLCFLAVFGRDSLPPSR